MVIGRLSKLCVLSVILAGLLLPGHAWSQDQREIDLIADLGKELIAQREAAAAAAAEAEHRRLLEEQTKLKEAYQAYLGQSRRTAQALIAKKRKGVTQQQIDMLRQRARLVIDEVSDATKQRVRNELDVIYEQLEQAIAATPDELARVDANLVATRNNLIGGNAGRNLDWVDNTAVLYAICESKEHASIIAKNVTYREQLSEDEAMAIDECNRRRLVLGLRPLAIDIKLVECSRDHSKDMIDHNFFSHTSPLPGKASPWDRAKLFGAKANGENIAAGYSDGYAVTKGWWYSPGHLKNMMGRGFKRIGVGQTRQHYTQLFGN